MIFENISTSFYALKINLPKIDVRGSNLAKADIEKMFDQNNPVAERIKSLIAFTAASVGILSYSPEPFKLDGTFNDNKMEKISGGKNGKRR